MLANLVHWAALDIRRRSGRCVLHYNGAVALRPLAQTVASINVPAEEQTRGTD
jgi:hypothetical protein